MPDPAALFKSISDPVRLRLLRLLAQEEVNVQELVAITGLSQPRVSKHLGLLRKQGLITQRREGTWSWYRLCKAEDAPGGAALLEPVVALAAQVAEAPEDDRGLHRVLAERQMRARDFFSGMADRWDAIRRHYEHPDLDVGMMGALVEPGIQVLDVGTGTGAILKSFAVTGARVLALDHTQPMLVRARELCRGENLPGVDFCAGGVENLPLRDECFDVVNCAMVLHHVARPARAVAEMARVTRPGGRVTVTSFCPHQQEWMREELAHQWLGFSQPEMEQFFTDAGLEPASWLSRGPLTGTGSGARWPDIFLTIARKTNGDSGLQQGAER